MDGAVVLLVVNSAVAGLFALSYFLTALITSSGRRVVFFGASYLIGMLTPISELCVHWAADPTPFMILSYGSLLAGFLGMSLALSIFEGKRPLWAAIVVIALGGAVARFAIWGGKRDDLGYELIYQLPFCLALLLCAVTVWLHGPRRKLRPMLALLFGLISLNFLIKPFVAAAVGSGESAGNYTKSAYALFSQASTGIMLIAAGLAVLILVIQTRIHEYMHASEIDHLSGLLNRRGFDRQAQTCLSTATAASIDISVIMMDLDHFKSINDRFGHDTGDDVIRAFANIIRNSVPNWAIIARTGGEEFAVLLKGTPLEGATLICEMIRQQIVCQSLPDLPTFTFSAGVAQWRQGQLLSDLMRKADQATYLAKNGGRNRTEHWVSEDPRSDLPLNIVPLRPDLPNWQAA